MYWTTMQLLKCKKILVKMFSFTINNETEVISRIAKEIAVSVLNIEAKQFKLN